MHGEGKTFQFERGGWRLKKVPVCDPPSPPPQFFFFWNNLYFVQPYFNSNDNINEKFEKRTANMTI